MSSIAFLLPLFIDYFQNMTTIISTDTTHKTIHGIWKMKRRIKQAARRAAANPVLRQSARSLKPTPNLWGVLGTVLFFILPEIIGFWRGKEIAAWAHAQMLQEPDAMGRQVYWLLEKLFEEGGSWINLGIGVTLLGWIFYEWRHKTETESTL